MSNVSKKKVIAITGSMGSGKSQVSMILKEKYPVIDCDVINAQLLIKGNKGYEKLLEFDWDILDDRKEIDKKKMASYLFSNSELKKKVEAILHPLIRQDINNWVQKQDSKLVFVEVPILFEIGWESYFDEIWCIIAKESVALSRLITYRNFTRDEAMKRISHQLDPSVKMSKSDIVIENNGSIKMLEDNINKILMKE